jgi:hypothetical protein
MEGISRQRVEQIIARELDRRRTAPSEDTERARAMDVERCDRMLRRIEEKIRARKNDDEEITDEEVRAWERVMTRRAKLLGLDAPVRTIADLRHDFGEDLALADLLTTGG